MFARCLPFPVRNLCFRRSFFCVLGDLGCMGTAMQLREISRERVRSVGLREGLFLVRRVWRRVNISLSYRTNARHLREIRYPRSFGIIREAPRTTENFPLCWPMCFGYAARALKESRQVARPCVSLVLPHPQPIETSRGHLSCVHVGLAREGRSMLSGVGRLRVLIGVFRRHPICTPRLSVSPWLVSFASCTRKRHAF